MARLGGLKRLQGFGEEGLGEGVRIVVLSPLPQTIHIKDRGPEDSNNTKVRLINKIYIPQEQSLAAWL
jgi:hypothetical protein